MGDPKSDADNATTSKAIMASWRAADDLRRGWPVRILSDGQPFLVLSLDSITADRLAFFDQVLQQNGGGAPPAQPSRLVITARRAETLKIGSKGWRAVSLERPAWFSAKTLMALADPTADLQNPLKGPLTRLEKAPGDLEAAALTLCRMGNLLPAVLIAHLSEDREDRLLTVSTQAIFKTSALDPKLTVISNVHLPTESGENARLITLRPDSGGADILALVFEPEKPGAPLVRLHSECFTGDLLGSLKCDCGPQLRGAIHRLGHDGGGVLLYLPQEGRGIGLAAKLRAYALQDQGYDTVDANLRLGFDTDERDFRPAAEALKMLGMTQVRLMTNNPDKARVLQEEGITVVKREAHEFESNPFNRAYLETKKTRTGHLLS